MVGIDPRPEHQKNTRKFKICIIMHECAWICKHAFSKNAKKHFYGHFIWFWPFLTFHHPTIGNQTAALSYLASSSIVKIYYSLYYNHSFPLNAVKYSGIEDTNESFFDQSNLKAYFYYHSLECSTCSGTLVEVRELDLVVRVTLVIVCTSYWVLVRPTVHLRHTIYIRRSKYRVLSIIWDELNIDLIN